LFFILLSLEHKTIIKEEGNPRMCGIFGIVARENTLTFRDMEKFSNNLFFLSESRGKESSGITFATEKAIRVLKSPLPATTLIKNSYYKYFFEESIKAKNSNKNELIHQPIIMIGHSRLVTDGSPENHNNNQPVIKDGIVGVHNGIVVNDDHLWDKFPELTRLMEVDTEVILSLIRYFLNKPKSITQAVRATYTLIEGAASIALLIDNQKHLVLATNTGSLYICTNKKHSIFVFASEAYFLQKFLKSNSYQKDLSESVVKQVRAGNGFLINTHNLQYRQFSLVDSDDYPQDEIEEISPLFIQDFTPFEMRNSAKTTFSVPSILPASVYKKFEINEEQIKEIKRCTCCILPETMPFIEFDENGVCNYCRMYQKQTPLGEEELEKFVQKYRNSDGSPDCVIAFSGGRDSSFALHYAKTVLKMHPIAFTYDWGMITDLGRRNQARLCGKLGVEQILVSANINQKRENIRKNVLAWLQHPNLGTVPLFMAGDKQYFYYANKMRQQLGLDLIILAANPMEETFFKFGFCGLPPSLSRPTLRDQYKLAYFYGKEFLLNPAFINASLKDTLGAFASYYTIPHNYLRFYQYILWDEKTINEKMHEFYDWEHATDTKSTWRIGDGTAAFYNYIYYSVAGFCENDTFRSNQIREGMISRSEAIESIYSENQPRFESIQWYCDSININMTSALMRISQISKLYNMK
jgi:glutamine---fructose-6-phosphate transaminase (isomerizing)